MAKQLLFKKKLEDEQRKTEEKFRANFERYKTDDKYLEKVRKKQNLKAARKRLVSELETSEAAYQHFKQEEAVQKMLEIKVHNTEVERANRLTEIWKIMDVEEQI